VNARKFTENRFGVQDCVRETAQLLMCLQQTDFEETTGQCASQYAALAECAKVTRAAAAARKGHLPSINHHLSRMAKLMRR
jgi:hypothetical protein